MCWKRWECLGELLLQSKVIRVHVMKERGGVKLQPHSFLPLAVDGMNGHVHAPTVLSLGKETPVPIKWWGRYTPELLLTLWRKDTSLASPRNWTIHQMFNPWPNHSSDYAILIPLFKVPFLLMIFYFYRPLNIDLLTFRLTFFVFNFCAYVSED
jgi:hypothetical protein